MTTREEITAALLQFSEADLYDAGINLFEVLGYNTSRTDRLDDNTFVGFAEMFIQDTAVFRADKAMTDEWAQVEFLFQLTELEMTSEVDLFDTKEFNGTIMESYAFFALELKGETYTRSQLAQITREFNKLFNMPAMLVFKHGPKLTLAVINRRLHKRDNAKDVLEKVTLIKDIKIDGPHRAHVEILFDLSFEELLRKYSFSSFITLHDAWTNCLDTKELNKRFYQELVNWYFWAMDKVSFPDDIEKDKNIRNATNLIRLITRIIFVWFIKEKGLVRDILFNQNSLTAIIKDFNKNNKSHNYYHAILQNLFFATLNQKMDERAFAKDAGYPANRNEYGVKNLFRYENKFKLNDTEVLALFADIPFLNGGLFDCLDKEDEKSKVVYVDGFSREPKKQAIVPDYLFFSKEQEVDLNEIYGTRSKRYHVQGLINILDSYKFTVAENTPLEEEIALDPELLGKVFENLLASYNPETQTTARKQTGSFYTPREIVNYMVDESLLAYLQQKLEENAYTDCEDQLRDLLSYSENSNLFDDNQTNLLIQAIDNCKILDPACGSGAFPMGVLLKLVHLLQKLDPENQKWKEQQLEKVEKLIRDAKAITDSTVREKVVRDLQQTRQDIEESFNVDNNELDYGRKLYLIENCIYGIDIQPIAVQIAKLRFFISLIIDQRKQPTKPNLGIRSLPNLETKFVAANTLIKLEKPDVQGTLENQEINKMKNELKELRHRYFNARTRNEKLRLQRKDKKLRKEISKLLINNYVWDSQVAQQLITFNPYDQNISVSFFDLEWMFGITDGFDIVIGNPPYVKESTHKNAFDGLRMSPYYQGKMDLWYYFGCIGLDVLKKNGFMCYIATNNWISNDGASKFRDKILKEGRLLKYVDFGNYKIFAAGIQTMILLTQKCYPQSNYPMDYSKLLYDEISNEDLQAFLSEYKQSDYYYKQVIDFHPSKYMHQYITFVEDSTEDLLTKISKRSNFSLMNNEIFSGIDVLQDFVKKSHLEHLEENAKINDGIFVLSSSEVMEMGLSKQENELLKPYFTTQEIRRYYANRENKYWIIYIGAEANQHINNYPAIKRHLDKFKSIMTSVNKPYGLHRTRDKAIFIGDKILSIRKGIKPQFSYVTFPCYVSRAFLVIKTKRINVKYLLAILNSKLIAFWLMKKGKMQGNHYQVDKNPLLKLPLYKGQNRYISQISIIVDYIIETSLDMVEIRNKFEQIIDGVVYELYFSKEVTAADANILCHLDNLPDIQPLIEKGQTEKALKTIERVYKELSDPNHPVSIAMARMQEIEEVQIIEGKK